MKKRNFRKLSGASEYRPWKDWQVGDRLVCKLVREGTDQFKKPSWSVEVEEVDFQGDEEAERKFAVGKTVTLNSCGSLDKVLESGEVGIGTSFQVVYQGTSPMKKGPNEGADAHSLEISVADDAVGFTDTEEEGSDEFGGL